MLVFSLNSFSLLTFYDELYDNQSRKTTLTADGHTLYRDRYSDVNALLCVDCPSVRLSLSDNSQSTVTESRDDIFIKFQQQQQQQQQHRRRHVICAARGDYRVVDGRSLLRQSVCRSVRLSRVLSRRT